MNSNDGKDDRIIIMLLEDYIAATITIPHTSQLIFIESILENSRCCVQLTRIIDYINKLIILQKKKE